MYRSWASPIATTTAMAEVNFRDDLFYRLRSGCCTTPSLAERATNMALLPRLFLRRASDGRASFSPNALDWLTGRFWSGNVRELRAAVECGAALAIPSAAGTIVTGADVAFAVGDTPVDVPPPADPQSLEEGVAALERRRIVEALKRIGHNHTHAARELGRWRVGLLTKMNQMGLR